MTSPTVPRDAAATLPPPVKVLAEAHGHPGLPAGQGAAPRGGGTGPRFAPDLIVVIAFGTAPSPKPAGGAAARLAIQVLAPLAPPLPRRCAPITGASSPARPRPGITTMQRMWGLDTGDMLLKKFYPHRPDGDARRCMTVSP